MHQARGLAGPLVGLLASGLVIVTLVIGPPATAMPAGDTTAPTLSMARIQPKVLTGARKALLKITSTEVATLRGVVLLKQDGRWNAATQEKSWTLDAGHNVRLLYSKADLSVLRDGRYRIRLSAVDADGNRSAKIVLSFRIDH
jgi:hypothetical protein